MTASLGVLKWTLPVTVGRPSRCAVCGWSGTGRSGRVSARRAARVGAFSPGRPCRGRSGSGRRRGAGAPEPRITCEDGSSSMSAVMPWAAQKSSMAAVAGPRYPSWLRVPSMATSWRYGPRSYDAEMVSMTTSNRSRAAASCSAPPDTTRSCAPKRRAPSALSGGTQVATRDRAAAQRPNRAVRRPSGDGTHDISLDRLFRLFESKHPPAEKQTNCSVW